MDVKTVEIIFFGIEIIISFKKGMPKWEN